MNKKGSLTGFLDNLQFIFVLVLVLVLVVGLIYGLVTLGSPAVGETKDAVNEIKSAFQKGDLNNSQLGNATEVTANMTTGVLGKMELFVYAIFFGLFIGFLVVAYEVKFYPFLSFVWIGLMFVVVIFSIILSNAYQEASIDPATSEYYSTWGDTEWLMIYLPHIFAVLGVISGILLFALSTRSPDEEINTGSVNL